MRFHSEGAALHRVVSRHFSAPVTPVFGQDTGQLSPSPIPPRPRVPSPLSAAPSPEPRLWRAQPMRKSKLCTGRTDRQPPVSLRAPGSSGKAGGCPAPGLSAPAQTTAPLGPLPVLRVGRAALSRPRPGGLPRFHQGFWACRVAATLRGPSMLFPEWTSINNIHAVPPSVPRPQTISRRHNSYPC